MTGDDFNVTEAATEMMQKENRSICFIFHDVDMLPVSFFDLKKFIVNFIDAEHL